jgi:hypothetical protein
MKIMLHSTLVYFTLWPRLLSAFASSRRTYSEVYATFKDALHLWNLFIPSKVVAKATFSVHMPAKKCGLNISQGPQRATEPPPALIDIHANSHLMSSRISIQIGRGMGKAG